MPTLDYMISDDDIKAQKGLDETAKNAPDPKVILDMQATLANALQPTNMPQGEAQAPASAKADWSNEQ